MLCFRAILFENRSPFLTVDVNNQMTSTLREVSVPDHSRAHHTFFTRTVSVYCFGNQVSFERFCYETTRPCQKRAWTPRKNSMHSDCWESVQNLKTEGKRKFDHFHLHSRLAVIKAENDSQKCERDDRKCCHNCL